MATLSAIFDHETGSNPVLIETQQDLDALVERVRERSTGHPCPSIVEISDAADPWGSPTAYAGIGDDRGFVQVHDNPMRATRGRAGTTGTVVYDLVANATDIPADQEVPLDVVRTVLAAYLAHNSRIPADHPLLNIVS
ncbi:Imm1 family immunity protein [Actinosynnema sp.]|uniref:Imm1 family immunity protein n=1 Tax=Actinosynnema sp. TaxID=1872144 RepID=UPI003F83B5F1